MYEINLKIKDIEERLPEMGRRLELIVIRIPEEWFNILCQDEGFNKDKNLGGVPVEIGTEPRVMVEYIQGQKCKRPWAGRDRYGRKEKGL